MRDPGFRKTNFSFFIFSVCVPGARVKSLPLSLVPIILSICLPFCTLCVIIESICSHFILIIYYIFLFFFFLNRFYIIVVFRTFNAPFTTVVAGRSFDFRDRAPYSKRVLPPGKRKPRIPPSQLLCPLLLRRRPGPMDERAPSSRRGEPTGCA